LALAGAVLAGQQTDAGEAVTAWGCCQMDEANVLQQLGAALEIGKGCGVAAGLDALGGRAGKEADAGGKVGVCHLLICG
jgi:hypothetical protein